MPRRHAPIPSRHRLRTTCAAILALIALGCAGPGQFGGSREAARSWAEAHGFSETILQAGEFELTAFTRRGQDTDRILSIYIEGDGAAWPTPYHPPRDPTPLRPIALALAAQDASTSVAYLGRPCQYLDAKTLPYCPSAYWIEKRFAPEVIAAFELAVDALKKRLGAERVRLIGHSGGGVLATLLALRRNDVESVITVASPLALTEWVRVKGLSPLAGSLDPLREPGVLPSAIHWIGGDDDVVPTTVVQVFAHAKGGRVRLIPDYDHHCCWIRTWPELIKESP